MMLPPGLVPKQHLFHTRPVAHLIFGPASMASPGLAHGSAQTSTLLPEAPLKIMPPKPSHVPWCALIANSSPSGNNGVGCRRSILSSMDGVCSSASATAAPPIPPAEGSAMAVAQPLPTKEDASCISGNCQGRRRFFHKAMSASGKPKRTLLVAYLPRCTKVHDVQNAFARVGVDGCRLVSIMLDENGVSKCFGFVEFSTCDTARAAMEACRHGQIILLDYKHKPWHVQADWAKAECRHFTVKKARAAMASWSC